MAEVLFYHLQNTKAEAVLPGLLERSLARGWKVVVRCADGDEVTALDGHLWTFSDESFLPHGAGAFSPAQPIWLTAEDDVPEGRDVLFITDQRGIDPKTAQRLTRVILLFGADGAAPAREVWKSVKAAGLEATYWKQTPQGGWEKAG